MELDTSIKLEDVELMYSASDIGKKFVQLCAMEEGYHARHAKYVILYGWKFLIENPQFMPNNIYIE